MANGADAGLLLATTSGRRPIACNRAALELFGLDPAAFASMDGEELAALAVPGRRRIRRADGSFAEFDVSTDPTWVAVEPVELLVARPVANAGDGDGDAAVPRSILDPLLPALEAYEGSGATGVALLFVEVAGPEAADDQLLAAVEANLREAVRRTDVVAVTGPGQYAVLCHVRHGEIDAAGLAAGLVDALGLLAPVEVAVALPGDPGMTVRELLASPAGAAAAARTQGRARHAAFTEAAAVRSRRQTVVAAALRRALDAGELSVHYQPVIDLREGSVNGVEALARWQPANGAAIAPDRFIPVAERSGLIVELGDWVLRTACTYAAGRPDLTMAVNVSPCQVTDDLPARVARTLDETGLDPGRLELELTESAVLDDPEHASEVLRAVTDLGVRLSLDDFGTGYSSLLVLRRLPFDRLKIDRSFVRTVADTTQDRAIVAAIVSLAEAVAVDVTAEGVETVEQCEVLADVGCRDAQGFLFAAPMAPDACDDWLRAG